VKAFLWVLGSILLLDVLLVAIFAACAAVVRRRAPHPALDAASGWPFETGRGRPQILAAVPAATDDDDEPGPSRRDLVRLVREDEPPAAPPPVRRAGRRRAVGAALAATLVVAGTAVASPEVRQFVATAIGVVSDGLTSTSVGPDQAADISGGDTATTGDVSSGPAAASGTSAAERPRPGSTPGPAAGGRPPGVPHQGVPAPATPANVTAMPVGSGEIAVAWADVEGETSYRVERALDISGPWTMSGTPAQDVTAVTDSGLSAGTTYFYRIIAINGDVQSEPSDVASATTTVDVPSSPATMIVTAAGADRIDLQWDNVADESGYRLERSSDGDVWTTVGTTGRDVTDASDTGLAAGTTYWYRVFASNVAGESPPSVAASATTDQPSATGDQGGGPDPGSAARVSTSGAAGTDPQTDTTRRSAR